MDHGQASAQAGELATRATDTRKRQFIRLAIDHINHAKRQLQSPMSHRLNLGDSLRVLSIHAINFVGGRLREEGGYASMIAQPHAPEYNQRTTKRAGLMGLEFARLSWAQNEQINLHRLITNISEVI